MNKKFTPFVLISLRIVLILSLMSCRINYMHNSYIVKIFPNYTQINDGLLRNRKCIQGEANGEKKLYCQGIEGFEYEEGYEYELEITEEKIENLPADYLADRKYILKKIISKKATSKQNTQPKITEISISTVFDNTKTNSSGYHYIFSLTNDGKGFGNRVAAFENIDQWKADTKAQLAKSKSITGEDYIIETLSKEIESKVDFSKENLVIVYAHTGGPPFGKLKYELKRNTYHFYIDEPKVSVKGMALKTFFNFYTTNRAVLLNSNK